MHVAQLLEHSWQAGPPCGLDVSNSCAPHDATHVDVGKFRNVAPVARQVRHVVEDVSHVAQFGSHATQTRAPLIVVSNSPGEHIDTHELLVVSSNGTPLPAAQDRHVVAVVVHVAQLASHGAHEGTPLTLVLNSNDAHALTHAWLVVFRSVGTLAPVLHVTQLVAEVTQVAQLGSHNTHEGAPLTVVRNSLGPQPDTHTDVAMSRSG